MLRGNHLRRGCSRNRIRPMLAVLGTAWACGKTAAKPSARTVAGCYAFNRVGALTPALGRELPDTLLLDSAARQNTNTSAQSAFPMRVEVLSRRPDVGQHPWMLDGKTIPWPPDWSSTYYALAWRFAPPDSVTVVLLPLGMQGPGWELELRAEGDSLIGRAEPRSDMVPDPRGTIAVVGRRTPCRNSSEPLSPAT